MLQAPVPVQTFRKESLISAAYNPKRDTLNQKSDSIGYFESSISLVNLAIGTEIGRRGLGQGLPVRNPGFFQQGFGG